MNTLLHTPAGVLDRYHSECAHKRRLQEKIETVMRRYGYQPIETPTFEFLDVFSQGKTTDEAKNLYKFFDREGHILALRPDFTPPIARVASSALADAPMPLRLCYAGSTFYNHPGYRGELHEETNIGAELIGDASVEADAEMAAMMADGMEAVGLTDYQLSIGQNDFFKSIVREAGLDAPTQEELRTLILNHNIFGVEELIARKEVSSVIKSVFLKLPVLFGGADVLEDAYRLTVNEQGKAAIGRIKRLYRLLQYYGADKHVTFDFSMLGKYTYYTGVTFRVYTYGTGDAIMKGGRYDTLLGKFGKARPAIGFAASVDELLSAMKAQHKTLAQTQERTQLFYTEAEEETAILLAGKLRKNGQEILLQKRGEQEETSAVYREKAAAAGASAYILLRAQGQARLFSFATGRETDFDLTALLPREAPV